MKIERSYRTKADAAVTRRGVRSICCLLFLVAAVVAAVGAVASPRANQGLLAVSSASPANIIVVTNTNDSGPGSLRDALAVANDGDTIDATGVSGTILLTSSELQITHAVTINGPGAGNLALDGDFHFRVLENFASDVTISDLTITNGFSADNNGGGGILNHGELTLSDSIVSNSSVADNNGQGGGVSNNPGATLTVTGSAINGNYACCGGAGGGIFGDDDATVTVINSTINGNGVGCLGGGIFILNAQLTVLNSTISGNSADGFSGICEQGSGGGIWLYGVGTLTVTNSTISGNETTGGGGGILLGGGTATVTNSTISENSAQEGGGIFNSATATILDTVLKAGELGGTIFNNGGTVISLGYNLASDDAGAVLTGPGDQINTDPMLGALQNNGGPTFTNALLPGSPGINAGDPNFTPPPNYDQRGLGFDRIVDGRIDVGAFEVQGPTPTPTVTATATPSATRPSPTARPRPTVHPRPSL